MGVQGPFQDVDDSPWFKLKAQDMDSKCRHLKDRVGALVKGYRGYRDALVALCAAQVRDTVAQ